MKDVKINSDSNDIEHPPLTPTNHHGGTEIDTQDAYVQRILEAGRDLFAESGLDAVSMYGIAKRAGIGQGSLYRRFRDKGEICSALIRDSSERFLVTMEEELLHPILGPLDHLRDTIVNAVDFIEQHAELLHLIKSEFIGKRQLTQFEQPFFQRLNRVMTELLQRAVDAKETIDMDPQFTATALIAVLSPDLYLYQQKQYGLTKIQITEGILRLFVTGLKQA
ncbi:AcrR family transcriptional regulator [Paenibacillus shirakamiensis]|uniref:AcrR family transcriptional regulator n=1 Tax=Paenibacillus shirakamiensis TaxID=1265935 RepID=A0ABS4JE07_9BACL|nr:TetR/AcrR family transcriptional regulator [Paenibacillus shirakamiensis]MBP1999943.1 AcrR family transcriptional regulator [Paenibacillus shirakamiensis]